MSNTSTSVGYGLNPNYKDPEFVIVKKRVIQIDSHLKDALLWVIGIIFTACILQIILSIIKAIDANYLKQKQEVGLANPPIAFCGKNHDYLPFHLYQQVLPLINNREKLCKLEKARCGKTNVYFPPQIPIVIKESGALESQERFEKMSVARQLCVDNNYTKLIIPTARVHGDFIIESRLPISKKMDTKYGICSYLQNTKAFDGAVSEFTKFLCQASLNDLTGASKNNYSNILSTDNPQKLARYDNAAPYLENGVGKIGLIDLEKFSPRTKIDKEHVLKACLTAIRFFPHHLDIILAAGKEFDITIEGSRDILEKEQKSLLDLFKIIYQDHFNFLKEKNINLENPVKLDTNLTAERKEQIKSILTAELEKANKSALFKNALGENPSVNIKIFNDKIFPEILDQTLKFVKNLLNFSIEKNGGIKGITSFSDLMAARSIILNRSGRDDLFMDLEKKLYDMINKEFKLDYSQFDHNNLGNFGVRDFGIFIIDVILQELANGREIAYYNRHIGNKILNNYCIFC